MGVECNGTHVAKRNVLENEVERGGLDRRETTEGRWAEGQTYLRMDSGSRGKGCQPFSI